MSALRPPSLGVCLLVGFGAALVTPPCARAASGDEAVTAVSSRVSDDYVRIRLPDGSFRPETYALGQGGDYGGPDRDSSIDAVGFMYVARAIAVPLASQNYVPTKDPHNTRLLIMVYWGTATGPSDNPAQFPARILVERQIERNAKLLGYYGDLVATEALEHTALDRRRRDLRLDMSGNRYFVVLMAYDFPMMWRQKKHKLLWETRFSLREHTNDFGRDLPAMAQFASRYFGQASNGLIRRPLPEGRVDMGEAKSLGLEPEK